LINLTDKNIFNPCYYYYYKSKISTFTTYKNIIASPKGVLENSLWTSSKENTNHQLFYEKRITLNTEKCIRGLNHTIG